MDRMQDLHDILSILSIRSSARSFSWQILLSTKSITRRGSFRRVGCGSIAELILARRNLIDSALKSLYIPKCLQSA